MAIWRACTSGLYREGGPLTTHNRLFDTLADREQSVQASLSYFQTARQRIITLINGRSKKTAK